MENIINKNTLFENFAGRSTPLFRKLIEEWLQSPGNIELYYEWLDEWEKANPQFLPNEARALKKILQDREERTVVPVDLNKRGIINRFFHFRAMAARSRIVAAGIIFLFISGGVFFLKGIIFYQSMTTAFGETRSIVLPDGSLVSMNAHSTIRYPRFGFGNKSREVYLSGEADFSVIHTKNNRQFLVKTDNNLDVVVLGTRFTVYTRGEQAKVVLKQGKVELNFLEEKQYKRLIMYPGDLFTSNGGGATKFKLEHIQHPENLSAWKNHEFLFDGTSLSEIAKMIKDDFGLAINFENAALAEQKISGSFHADTANELLDVIAQLLNIHYKTKGDNTIYFSE